MNSRSLRFAFVVVLFLSARADATSNYEYRPDEYVVITDGRSPDGKYSIAAHGEGELGDENFHLYLMDAGSADLHGKYTVSFSNDGTYSFVTTRENEKPDVRKGSYKWHVKDNRNAVLDLGDDEVYSLKFQSTTQATGQVTDDVRTYKFTFSK